MGETLAELGAAIAVLDKTPTTEQVAAHIHKSYQVRTMALVRDLVTKLPSSPFLL